MEMDMSLMMALPTHRSSFCVRFFDFRAKLIHMMCIAHCATPNKNIDQTLIQREHIIIIAAREVILTPASPYALQSIANRSAL